MLWFLVTSTLNDFFASLRSHYRQKHLYKAGGSVKVDVTLLSSLRLRDERHITFLNLNFFCNDPRLSISDLSSQWTILAVVVLFISFEFILQTIRK